MALVYPVVVAFSVILSLIAGDGFTGPTINTADFNDIGVAQFYQLFRCLLTPITAAAVYQNQLIFIRQLWNVLCADEFVGNILRLTQAAQGDLFDERINYFLGNSFHHISQGNPGSDCIHSNTLRTQFPGKRNRQAIDSKLGCWICKATGLAVNANH